MCADFGVCEVGRVFSDIVLANNQDVQLAARGIVSADKVIRVQTRGIVDTGANHVVVPQSIADQLQLPVQGTATVRFADNRPAQREIVHQLWMEVCGRTGVFRAIVEPNRDTVLIGVLVLEDLDLIVDAAHETLAPRDPEHFTTIIE